MPARNCGLPAALIFSPIDAYFMLPLALLTRPRPDSETLAALLRDRGVASLIEPVIDILPLEDAELPKLEKMQALLLTSANGVRALARLLGPPPEARHIALLAVGAASAEAARQAGFQNVHSAGGDVDALAALAKTQLNPARGPLLHVAGSKVAGDLAAMLESHGFDVHREQIYEARKSAQLSSDAQRALADGKIDMVLFFSPRSARAFAKLSCAAAVDSALAQVTAICLSAAVAEAACGVTWRRVRTAREPEQAALLDEVAREINVAEHSR
jgi:uroporphyrinogen-III synthase